MIEFGTLLFGILLEIVAVAFSYGKLTQKLQDLTGQVKSHCDNNVKDFDRHERMIERLDDLVREKEHGR